jgi:arylsulfatase A-like enzyme
LKDHDLLRTTGPAPLLSYLARRVSADPFLLALAIIALIVGGLIRFRIYTGMAVPPRPGLLWFVHGTLQDLILTLLVLIAFSVMHRWLPWPARAAMCVWVIVTGLLHLMNSELLIVLGHSVGARDLMIGAQTILLSGSIQGSPVVPALILAFSFASAVIIAWSLVRRRQLRISLGALLASTGVLALAIFLSRTGTHTGSADHPLVAFTRLLPELRDQMQHGADPPLPDTPLVAIRALAAPETSLTRFTSPEFPLSRQIDPDPAALARIPSDRRPNIVILLLESFRAHEVGAYGGLTPSVTPTIDSLAREGILVRNFYSAGSRTPEGEVGVLYGLPANPEELLMLDRPHAQLRGLPEVLREHGWLDFLWINGSDQTFYGNGLFYALRGFRVADGRAFAPDQPRTNWGYSDKVLMRHTVSALDRSREPFLAVLLTTTNHHPFDLPSDATSRAVFEGGAGIRSTIEGFQQLSGRYTEAMTRTMHYTDEAVALLLDLARNRPWFENTLFVLVGDHGIAVPPRGPAPTLHGLVELQQRVPLILYSPLIRGGLEVEGLASQMDIFPTLLDLLGISTSAPIFGRSLLSPTTTAPQHPMISWEAHSRRVTLRTEEWTYHGELPRGAGPPANELLVAATDPAGEHNLAATHPDVVAEMRNLTRIWREVYPWLLASGRLGTSATAAD